ncbi:TrkH family potassium uptake protein [bacterium AH-315-E10]|nr:TrkH family potassium uptake protein [bacterium AH-315-E10]
MNYRIISRIISTIISIIGVAMLTAVPVALLMGDARQDVLGLLTAALITLTVGAIGVAFIKPASSNFRIREGFCIVTFSWIGASVFGALPYILVGNMGYADSFFESMSGMTTTGATVIADISAMSRGLLYWRCLSQWLGGMGIVVLSLAVLPLLGIGGIQLYKAEVPGPSNDQLTPRIANAAKILWLIYLLLTFSVLVLLKLCGMSLYDALCHSFTTIATSGFSTQNASIGAYDNACIDWIIIVFMFLAGCNFILHLRFLKGQPLGHFKDEEFRFYFLTTIITIAIVSGILLASGHYGSSVTDVIRYASFSVMTIITTTGYSNTDYDAWPSFIRCLLFALMFIGACGGSTTGGIKLTRILLLLKQARYQLQRAIYPHSVTNVRINNHRITDDLMSRVFGFLIIYIVLFFVFTLALCIIEPNLGTPVDGKQYSVMETAFSSSVACLSNLGPGLAKVGPTQNFAWFSAPSKLLLAFAMLLGRLELYTVLVLFLPFFWKR